MNDYLNETKRENDMGQVAEETLEGVWCQECW